MSSKRVLRFGYRFSSKNGTYTLYNGSRKVLGSFRQFVYLEAYLDGYTNGQRYILRFIN